MHQPDFDVSSVRPPVLAGATPGWFKEGDEVSNILGSILTAGFMNDLLGNLLALKAATGVTWTKGVSGDSDLINMLLKLIFPEFDSDHLRFGNGCIVQWGAATLATGNGNTVILTYPYANALFHVMTCDAGAQAFSTGAGWNGSSKNSFLGYMKNNAGAYAAGIMRYLAIGW